MLATASSEERENLQNTALFYLFLLIGVGIMLYFFFMPDTRARSQTVVPTDYKESSIDSNSAPSPVPHFAADWVKVKGALGEYETNVPIRFTMEDFDERRTYWFSFGDGSRVSCRNGKVEHTYSRPGKYKVKVYLEKDGAMDLIWSKQMTVKPGIIKEIESI